MVKLGSSLAVALLATSVQANNPALRSTPSRQLAFDMDLPWIGVHVGNNGSVSVKGPFVNVEKPAHGGPVTVNAPGVDVSTNDHGHTTISAPFTDVDADQHGNVVVQAPGVDAEVDHHGHATISAPFTDVDSDEHGNVSVHAPGVDTDVDHHGNVSVHAPGVDTTTDEEGNVSVTHPYGDGEELPEDNHEDNRCKPSSLPEAKKVNAEASCQKALPDFFENLSLDKFTKEADKFRVSVMDSFCQTKCGPAYTDYLLASRSQDLKCGHVAVADKDEGKDIKDEVKEKDKEGKEIKDEVSDFLSDLFHVDVGKAGKPAATNYRTYPGLVLGCTRAEDGAYCSLKKATLTGKQGCDFFRTCCWGEYLKGLEEMDEVIAQIEKKCPGSSAYTKKTCTKKH